jgi:hypothetical protein
VRDAILALEAAVKELTQAAESLPDDMSEEVRTVVAKAEALLETLRSKLAADPESA